MTILAANGLAKHWGESSGLAPLSFALQASEVVVVRGRSGSGKSTLLALLAGWCAPDGGSVDRFGDWALEDAWRSWRHTTVVPQVLAPVPELSVTENIGHVLALAGVRRPARSAPVAALVERLDLQPEADRLPRETSVGQQQRLAVARALVAAFAGPPPTLVLADEPTSHQDAGHAGAVLDAFRDVAALGAAVLMTSHDDAVAAAADRVIELAS
jgi:putative ABC transport system ATP-binding protein